MNSVLSGFNLSLLFPIHAWAASRQFVSSVVLEKGHLKDKEMHDRQPMGTLSYRSDMLETGSISHNFNNAVLNALEPAKVKSRETAKQ